jgi:hypothetical protein
MDFISWIADMTISTDTGTTYLEVNVDHGYSIMKCNLRIPLENVGHRILIDMFFDT